MPKIWLRTLSVQRSSWAFVWLGIRKYLRELQIDIFDDVISEPEKPKEWIEVWIGNPLQYDFCGETKAKIAITVSETPSLHPLIEKQVLQKLNRCNAIVVPSLASAICYMGSAIDLPIFVLPFGVDTDELQFAERDWSDSARFRFLLPGVVQFRKGSWMAIEAFAELFSDNMDAELTVWSTEQPPMFYGLRENFKACKNIIFDHKVKEDLYHFYSKFHVGVFPHLSEGFGLIIPECMATGMPCIVSRTSAPREYFSKDFGWWIEMSDEFVSTEMFQKEQPGSWRLPDAESLEQYMKEAYEDRQTCYRKGRAAAEFVKENLNWRKTAEGLVKIAEEFDNAENISDNSGIQRASIVTHMPGQLYRVCG